MTTPDPDLAKQKRRRRWTWGGLLGALASIVTIVSFLSQQSSSSSNVQTIYPVNVQANYLNACEVNAPESACQCTLTWFETNVPLDQFVLSEQAFNQTGQPTEVMREAVAAC